MHSSHEVCAAFSTSLALNHWLILLTRFKHHKSSPHHLWCNLNHWKKLYAVRDSLHYPPYLHLPPKIHRRFRAPREWNPWTCKKVKNKHTRNLRLLHGFCSFYGKTNIPFSSRQRPGDENVPRSTLGIHKEVHSEGRKSQEKLEEKDPIAEWWQSLRHSKRLNSNLKSKCILVHVYSIYSAIYHL